MVGVVFLLTATFITHSSFAFGWVRTIVFLIVGFGVPYLSEAVGLRTGFPFGKYTYAGYLGPVLPLGIPAYVLLSWVLLLYSGIFVVNALATVLPTLQSDWSQIVFVSLLMVAMDALIDPVAVRVGHWIWDKPGKWFGIPAQNFFGWLLTAFATLSILNYAVDNLERQPLLEPLWLFYLPILMFGLLNLHFIGLLRKVNLRRLAPLALGLAIGMIMLYFVVVTRGA